MAARRTTASHVYQNASQLSVPSKPITTHEHPTAQHVRDDGDFSSGNPSMPIVYGDKPVYGPTLPGYKRRSRISAKNRQTGWQTKRSSLALRELLQLDSKDLEEFITDALIELLKSRLKLRSSLLTPTTSNPQFNHVVESVGKTCTRCPPHHPTNFNNIPEPAPTYLFSSPADPCDRSMASGKTPLMTHSLNLSKSKPSLPRTTKLDVVSTIPPNQRHFYASKNLTHISRFPAVPLGGGGDRAPSHEFPASTRRSSSVAGAPQPSSDHHQERRSPTFADTTAPMESPRRSFPLSKLDSPPNVKCNQYFPFPSAQEAHSNYLGQGNVCASDGTLNHQASRKTNTFKRARFKRQSNLCNYAGSDSRAGAARSSSAFYAPP